MPTDIREISIHRHCMQQLLHDAISCSVIEKEKQDYCQGLLAGGGNMIKKNLDVTGNTRLSQDASADFFANASDNGPITGVYLSTNATCIFKPDRFRGLIDLVQKHHGQSPDFYLLLELSHKGRVDALLFADAALTTPMTLNMQEDGNAAAIHG